MSNNKNLSKGLKQAEKMGDLRMTNAEQRLVSAVNSSNSEKASTFLDAINKYAKEQRDKIHNELETRKKEEIKKVENEVLSDAYKLIQHELHIMKKEITSKLSGEEIKNRKSLFDQRNEITADVFDKVKTKLAEFTKTEGYPKLLYSYAKATAGVLTEKNTVIFLRSEDMRYENEIKKAFPSMSGCVVKQADDILIGGLRGVNETMGLVVDETLDSKLAGQYQWFQKNSGLRID